MTRGVERTGGCLCGAVRYRVTGDMAPVVMCHCSQCLRGHGHIAAYSNARRDEVAVDGADHISWYCSSNFARRGFCRNCGSSLFWDRVEGDVLGIAAGTIDRPTALTSVAHIFVDDKSDYYDLSDGLRQFPQGYGSKRPGD